MMAFGSQNIQYHSVLIKNKKKVTIIDYGMGNLWSVVNALKYLNCDVVISSNPEIIKNSEMLVLPGVGSFNKAMSSIIKSGIDDAINFAVRIKQTKLLGICLGMQLLAIDSTEDGFTQGLGFISTNVNRFKNQPGKKVPHVGFNLVYSNDKSILFKSIYNPSDFYFVHSYRLLLNEIPGLKSTCEYGESFLAAYEFENIFATQFHPEKSQTNGLILLNNFLTY